MKKGLRIIVIVILLLFVGAGLLMNLRSYDTAPTHTTSPTQVPNTSQSLLCKGDDLRTSVSFEGAAGSIYGTFMITNKTTNTCTIIGKSSVSLQYDLTNKNISIHQKSPIKEVHIVLLPNKSVSAMAQFPNGPQCSSPVQKIPVTFTYELENKEQVSFSQKVPFALSGCTNSTEITTIEVTPFIE